ncbi:MAG TPA: pilus assembly protein TadG-related protein [Acidimicrobiia bacterium]|nr:pilus assembly protein TadG-related protein [Acidimicrobiia bacterium]
MRKMIVQRLTRRPDGDERGMALPLVAVMIVVLLGISAFAVDLGWLYLNGARLQRGADSSALAGVVFLPGDIDGVDDNTLGAATANGFDIGSINGTPVVGGGPDDLDWRQLADNKLEVTLATQVPTFFVKLFGFDSFSITRVATAEYVKPVPIGSPDPCFGVGITSIQSGDCNPATAQRFWAAVSGPYTNKWNGDAHSTLYWNDGTQHDNLEHRFDGYYLAVDVPDPGVSDLTVRVYDAGFYERGSFDVETGDRAQDTGGGADTHFQMYRFDDTPLDPTNNVAITGCSVGTGAFNITSGASSGTYKNNWVTLCRLSGPVAPGIYVIRVWTDGNDGGTNQFAVRANTGSALNARVYGINDISIFTNQSGISTLHVAEVAQVHAGKTLELQFYDPGEDDQEAWMTVKNPAGSTATCEWVAKNEAGTVVASSSGACRIKTSTPPSLFNGLWVTAQVEIPDSYTCTTNCWWKMEIENSEPHDRTTWAARIIGNPVRLVPNE